MQKPFTTEIIKLMAAHSDGAAAYASAMVWDYKRRLMMKELYRVSSMLPCAFCERYLKEGKEEECPLYKIFGDCCHYDDNVNLWQKASNAFEAKDQQAFTTAANDLYFLIRSIIDDLYKPKLEPKKEVFYHIGQRFRGPGGGYKLTQIDVCEVMMINAVGSSSVWGSRKKVKNPSEITEEEFAQICGPSTFTLIEDKK